MDMHSRLYWLIVVVMLGGMAMGACAPAATPTPAPIPTPTGPGGFPLGMYKPDHKLDAQYILFTAQGTFVVSFGDADTGSYTVNGDQIVFNMDAGVCHDKPGTYQWKLNGNTLTFKLINETCTASSRSDEMGGRSWIRQP
jgi:hypothetical protein